MSDSEESGEAVDTTDTTDATEYTAQPGRTYIKEVIVVKPENRITSDKLSKYEITEMISIRAMQIAQYNNCLVDIGGLTDPIDMAKREIMMRMCPLILRRDMGTRVDASDPKNPKEITYQEWWSPNEMQFPVAYDV
jgi:DNA-directed RNA polymerase subunit K/omega